ncbi:MAG: VWA domain-containing protein [Anaerolineae bacterium]|nr:VWA domain-containing protein [Anaerolineae bacterium]MCO5205582.1 VWA domain-containing protein [Anaerolineae bacterium]
MKLTKYLLLVFAIVVVILFPGIAAKAQSNVDKIVVADVDDARFPIVTFSATPFNRSGVPLEGITTSGFTVYEDGEPVEDVSIAQITTDENIQIMLVLDISGSMQDSLDELKQSAIGLFDSLDERDEVGIIAFSVLEDGSRVDLSDPFPQLGPNEHDITHDKGALINFVNQLQIEPNAGTPLYDAMWKGIRMMGSETDSDRHAVIVMTDGVDKGRSANEDGSLIADQSTVIEAARQEQVPVFTIGLGNDIDEVFLQRVATMSGGTFQITPDAAQLEGLFTDIARQLKQQYQFEFSSDIPSDNEQHELTVTAGSVEGSAAFRALFPEIPFFGNIMTTLQRQDARDLRDLESLKGIVTFEPVIYARNPIAEVSYYVNDSETPLYTANEAPWTIRWPSQDVIPNEVHNLRFEATDDAGNTGTYSTDILVEECSAICLIDQFINPLYLLIVVVVLLLLFGIFMARRRQQAAIAPVGGAYIPAGPTAEGPPGLDTAYAPPPPPVTPPAGGAVIGDVLEPNSPVTRQMNAAGGVGYGIADDDVPGGGRPSPKTEVLSREPGQIAFLIDQRSGRNFRLYDTTSIGRDAGNDIVLDDSSISGQHAKIRLEDGEFIIYDLASTNGTTINGSTITRQVLKDGDRIELGKKVLIFKHVEQ